MNCKAIGIRKNRIISQCQKAIAKAYKTVPAENAVLAMRLKVSSSTIMATKDILDASMVPFRGVRSHEG